MIYKVFVKYRKICFSSLIYLYYFHIPYSTFVNVEGITLATPFFQNAIYYIREAHIRTDSLPVLAQNKSTTNTQRIIHACRLG